MHRRTRAPGYVMVVCDRSSEQNRHKTSSPRPAALTLSPCSFALQASRGAAMHFLHSTASQHRATMYLLRLPLLTSKQHQHSTRGECAMYQHDDESETRRSQVRALHIVRLSSSHRQGNRTDRYKSDGTRRHDDRTRDRESYRVRVRWMGMGMGIEMRDTLDSCP